MNTLGFPNILYMAALGPTSNSTNVFVLRENNKKAKRNKRKLNENKKNTFGKTLNKFLRSFNKSNNI